MALILGMLIDSMLTVICRRPSCVLCFMNILTRPNPCKARQGCLLFLPSANDAASVAVTPDDLPSELSMH